LKPARTPETAVRELLWNKKVIARRSCVQSEMRAKDRKCHFCCNHLSTRAFDIPVGSTLIGCRNMARTKKLENMSFTELAKMEADIERIKAQKQSAEREAVREKILAIAKQHGFDIRELFGRKDNGKRVHGKVAVKYRDNAGNTWTGRGRMPRWMVAATKDGKAKKEDFLIA